MLENFTWKTFLISLPALLVALFFSDIIFFSFTEINPDFDIRNQFFRVILAIAGISSWAGLIGAYMSRTTGQVVLRTVLAVIIPFMILGGGMTLFIFTL